MLKIMMVTSFLQQHNNSFPLGEKTNDSASTLNEAISIPCYKSQIFISIFAEAISLPS
jgi:hypothetical protein